MKTCTLCGRETSKILRKAYCNTCYYRLLNRGELVAKERTEKFLHRLTNIDEVLKEAECATCGLVKIRKRGFSVSGTIQWRCSVDANLRSKQKKQEYRAEKRKDLGTNCEICGSHKNLVWDHNHKTGLFRGTLCSQCNTAIGLLKDNAEICIKASEYINRVGSYK